MPVSANFLSAACTVIRDLLWWFYVVVLPAYHVEVTPQVHASLFVRSPPPQVENVKEVLQLSAEQKGALVPVGELTVLLNKLSTAAAQEELATLTNGNAANGTSEFTKSRWHCARLKWEIRYLIAIVFLLLMVLTFFSRNQAQW